MIGQQIVKRLKGTDIYWGLTEAMAQQWGDFLLANANKHAFSDLFDYSEAVNE